MKKLEEIKVLIEDCRTIEELRDFKKKLTENDNRKSVLNLFLRYEKAFEKKEKLIMDYEQKSKYEVSLYNNFSFIAGIDEVGRGPLAGPVYAAVVILDKTKKILGIRDSKKLSERVREDLYEEIKQKAIDYALGYATVEEVDQFNILNATKMAMIRAIQNLRVKPEFLLIDAVKLDIDIPQISIIRGDDLSVSIGAASIMAKVERDRFMKQISDKFPQYNFAENKGYGTKEHIDAIKKYGPCILHRRTFIKNI